MTAVYRVRFSPEARDDLKQLYDYIASRSGGGAALAYIERIEAYCLGFDQLPQRGVSRDDILPGLRIVGFERRVTMAFHIEDDLVTFDRVLYGGRQLPPEHEM